MKTIDLSHLKTEAGVAKAIHRVLHAEAADLGQDPSREVSLRKPTDTGLVMDEYAHGRWHVAWEGGPSYWAHNLRDGIFSDEGFGPVGPKFIFPPGIYTEPSYSFVAVIIS